MLKGTGVFAVTGKVYAGKELAEFNLL